VCIGKEKFPTLAFEVGTNHKRKILSFSRSHYGSENDKTISKYDKYVMKMKYNFNEDEVFQLYDCNGNITNISGYYLICDNGIVTLC
jgi:hypothetical protein